MNVVPSEILNLRANIFNGNLPAGISQMSALRDLVLNSNDFSGSLVLPDNANDLCT